jgi:G3E family GTPase
MRNLSIIQNPFQRRFYPAAADQMRLPVALLTGFLGAGKTTLLNALLAHPAMADTAVAINEFGAVALDQHLIARDEGDVLVLANGCLCCNLAGDAEEAMLQLFARRAEGSVSPFRRLIVEPSGLADPAPLAQAILRNPLMARHMRLAGIIAVVDALFGARHLAQQPECGKQVAMADSIVVTKTDLADAAVLAALLRQFAALNPLAPHLIADHGRLDPRELFPAHFLNPDLPSGPERALPLRHADAGHAGGTQALVLRHDAPLDWPKLEVFLRDVRLGHADALLRLKGLVAIESAEGPLLLQGVHHVLHPPVALAAWPDDDRSTRLVLILRGSGAHSIRAGWAALTQPD